MSQGQVGLLCIVHLPAPKKTSVSDYKARLPTIGQAAWSTDAPSLPYSSGGWRSKVEVQQAGSVASPGLVEDYTYSESLFHPSPIPTPVGVQIPFLYKSTHHMGSEPTLTILLQPD